MERCTRTKLGLKNRQWDDEEGGGGPDGGEVIKVGGRTCEEASTLNNKEPEV